MIRSGKDLRAARAGAGVERDRRRAIDAAGQIAPRASSQRLMLRATIASDGVGTADLGKRIHPGKTLAPA